MEGIRGREVGFVGAVADIFREAARLNAEDARREGNVVRLDESSDVVIAGDLHGNRTGLAKVISYAALPAEPQRRLVLQEIIHGPVDPRTGHDRSAELLLRTARLKTAHPEQVYFLLANHDVAQLTGNEILKDGRGFCKGFDEGVAYCFGDEAPEIGDAIRQFLASAPLAVRCCGDVFVCHSLPSPNRWEAVGVEILSRPIRPEDLRRGGAVYEWTWGRRHTAEQLDALAGQLGAELFILGHQPCEKGFKIISPRGIILSSDHDRGCVIHLPANGPMTAEAVRGRILPLATLGKR